MVFKPWGVIIPPNTALPIIIDASGIRIPVFLRIIQDVGHEGPRIIDDGLNLDTVSYPAPFQPNTENLTSSCFDPKSFTIKLSPSL